MRSSANLALCEPEQDQGTCIQVVVSFDNSIVCKHWYMYCTTTMISSMYDKRGIASIFCFADAACSCMGAPGGDTRMPMTNQRTQLNRQTAFYPELARRFIQPSRPPALSAATAKPVANPEA